MATLKHMALSIMLFILSIHLGLAVMEHFGIWGYAPTISPNVNGAEEYVYWKTYTPQYSSYGIPLTEDTRNMLDSFERVLRTTERALLAIGAPKPFAEAVQAFAWLTVAALGMYLLLGREA